MKAELGVGMTWGRNEEPGSIPIQAIPDASLTADAHRVGTLVAAARLMRMQMVKDYLELAAHCESEAAKAQDKFSRHQLLSFAESYRMLAESAAALDRSAKALEIFDRRRKALSRAG